MHSMRLRYCHAAWHQQTCHSPPLTCTAPVPVRGVGEKTWQVPHATLVTLHARVQSACAMPDMESTNAPRDRRQETHRSDAFCMKWSRGQGVRSRLSSGQHGVAASCIPAGGDSGGRTLSTQCFAVGPGLILVWLHDLPVPCLSAWQPYSCQNARTCLSGGRNKVR